MILSQKQIEEIAAAVTEDFNKFFFGTESEEVRMARATPIDQFARDYLGLQVSTSLRKRALDEHSRLNVIRCCSTRASSVRDR